MLSSVSLQSFWLQTPVTQKDPWKPESVDLGAPENLCSFKLPGEAKTAGLRPTLQSGVSSKSLRGRRQVGSEESQRGCRMDHCVTLGLNLEEAVYGWLPVADCTGLVVSPTTARFPFLF